MRFEVGFESNFSSVVIVKAEKTFLYWNWILSIEEIFFCDHFYQCIVPSHGLSLKFHFQYVSLPWESTLKAFRRIILECKKKIKNINSEWCMRNDKGNKKLG